MFERIILANMNEESHSWTFKLHKVVQPQISGEVPEVVSFIPASFKVYLRTQKWKDY